MSTTGDRQKRRSGNPAPGPAIDPRDLLMPDSLRNDRVPDLPQETDELTADFAVIAATANHIVFRAENLDDIDEQTKRQLLADMQEALGIEWPDQRPHR